MFISRDEGVNYLRNGDFKALFIELLGWDKATDSRQLELDNTIYQFEAVAEKAGVTAYVCPIADITTLNYQTRQKLEHLARASFPSHIFVFCDDARWSVWQWMRRELGQPKQLRSVGPFGPKSSFEPILQKLDALAYDIDQENVQAVEVERDLRAAFDVEPVTRRFYSQFEAQYKEFLAAIEGVAAPYQREFASLLLNRLMFLYFMQRKGFLLGETDYLYQRFLDPTKRMPKHDDFFGGFLVPLFFEVLSVKPAFRGGKDNKNAHIYHDVFGEVLYLNGGLFSQRDWERNGKIKVPDAALKKIFDFFGAWNWHLDERPTRAGNEINPDVLGYVFEKFINQKQMGAYYTKEDITGYIARNTILPFLLEKSGLDLERPLQLLRDNIKRYIYPAVAHGCELELPANIALGIGDVAARGDWNGSAPADYALPTEIWREVVARRARYEALTGDTIQFHGVADLITHNLDIAQWMSDLIADINEAGELEALWAALEEVTILDPTVGSGAFLFAAMGVLGPVYAACLERMDAFVGEAHARAATQQFKSAPSHEMMEAVLREIAGHPNRAYAIFKKQAVENLYGVDIMPEASEICKLRLFLKLAAQVSPDDKAHNYGIEPLPDIDFNIRAGNTLVGFASAREVEIAAQTQINFGATWPDIQSEMESYGAALDNFRVAQLSGDAVTSHAKAKLNAQHDQLVEKLDKFNAGQYQQAPLSQPEKYAQWKASHQPFHWCAEFYSVMCNGGFDVIIGNPPYVEYSKVRGDYTIQGYETQSCGNLYAFVMERALKVVKNGGQFGVIVPLASVSTDRMESLQTLMSQSRRNNYVFLESTTNPSIFFVGVKVQLAIVLLEKSLAKKQKPHHNFSTPYIRAFSDERDNVFQKIAFFNAQSPVGRVPKLSNAIELSILEKIAAKNTKLGTYLSRTSTKDKIYVRRLGNFFFKLAFTKPPLYEINGEARLSSTVDTFYLNGFPALSFTGLINSTLMYWWWVTFSNAMDFKPKDMTNLCLDYTNMSDEVKQKLEDASLRLSNSLDATQVIGSEDRRNGDQIRVARYFPQSSKPIIDEIDRVLAGHYGFTDEELDFIINYDIKYRMGRESGGD